MKIMITLTFAILLCGCGCSTSRVPAQPGWKIIVNTDAEAAQLREMTGNDLMHTGKVVEVTAPTFIQGTK